MLQFSPVSVREEQSSRNVLLGTSSEFATQQAENGQTGALLLKGTRSSVG